MNGVLLLAAMEQGCRLREIVCLGPFASRSICRSLVGDVVQHAPLVGRIMCMHACMHALQVLCCFPHVLISNFILRVQYVCKLCCNAPV